MVASQIVRPAVLEDPMLSCTSILGRFVYLGLCLCKSGSRKARMLNDAQVVRDLLFPYDDEPNADEIQQILIDLEALDLVTVTNGSIEIPAIATKPTKVAAPRNITRKSRTLVPDVFPVTDEMRQWAITNGITIDIDQATRDWHDWWKSEGMLKADWVATWRIGMKSRQRRFEAKRTEGSASSFLLAHVRGDLKEASNE